MTAKTANAAPRPYRLPDGELEVMQAIWACQPPVDRRDVEAILFPGHPMAQTTLLTLIARLVDKGYLLAEKQGRRSVYTPLVAQRDYLADQSGSFFQRVCGGSVKAFAAALCDSDISKEDLAQLRDLLEKGGL